MEKEKVYVQFLGFSANPEWIPPPELLKIEKKYGGKLFEPNKLPKGFRLVPSAFGDYFLTYKNQSAFRVFWIKKGPRWYNYTRNKYGNPKKEFKEHIANLPWWNSKKRVEKKSLISNIIFGKGSEIF